MENFISGIHNYCDRWCERCAFTSRCTVFAMEQEWKERNPQNKEDWVAQVSDHLGNALQMIYEFAEKEGIALDTIKEEKQKIRPKVKQTKENVLNNIKHYEDQTRQWLENKQNIIETKQAERQELLQLGVTQVVNQSKEVENALEVIQWYFYFIRAKITRAWSGKEEKWSIRASSVQNDMNGSAKVAYIAVENSLAAWEILRTSFSELEKEILEIMIALSKIRKDINDHFPKHQKFIRPGFDD